MINKNPHLVITLFGIFLFIPFLGAIHLFDWDEINFAEAAREMIVSHNFSRVQINFEPFWEKPPLFFWMQVACMKLFGISEFAARLPNAICGIFTLNIIFYFGKKLFNEKLAWWWVLLFVGSFTPFFYFKSGIIDPWFNLFIFLGIIQLYLGANKSGNRTKNFLFCGLFLGLAVLTKGPVAILIVGLCGFVFLITNRFRPYFNIVDLIVLFISMIFIPLLWFLPDWITNGFWFTSEFLKYQADLFLHPVASHGQPWYYHPLVLLIGCFPAAIIGLPYLLKNSGLPKNLFVTFMKIMFWVVLILFSIVTTKIVHYSSLCYLPLTFIGAWGLTNSQRLLKFWQKFLIGLIGLLYSIVFIIMPLAGFNQSVKTFLINNIDDKFVKENLLTTTNWQGFEWIFGVIFFVILLSGFVFKNSLSEKGYIKIWLIGNASFLFVFGFAVMPKIENHVQGSIINFYKNLQGTDCYIETIGFKSYAHYFYAQIKEPKMTDELYQVTRKYCHSHNLDATGQLTDNQRGEISSFKKEWFIRGAIDKPVFLVFKVTNNEGIDTNKLFKLVLNKGGYKVFKRDKKL